MTFEGFDAALPLETSAFALAIETVAPGVASLDAALREAAWAERAAVRAEATILDLWVDRPDNKGFRLFERPVLGVGIGLQAWATVPGDEETLVQTFDDAKVPTMRAAFEDQKEEEIVVKGTRTKDMDDNSDWADFWSGGGSDGDGGSDMGDGGAGSLGDQQEPNDCRDRHALDAKTAIRADSNSSYKEHASVIYRDGNGQVQHSPPIEGGWGQIPMAEIVAWMNTNSVSMSQMIGLVHNHDPYNYGNATELNRYPSGGAVPGGDWDAADWFVSQGAGGPGGENFAMYIIDPAWRMREFDYADRAMYKGLNKTQREDGANLPGITQSDGSTCG